MFEEFHNRTDLLDPDIEEDDIENLLFSRLSSALNAGTNKTDLNYS